MHDFAQVFTSGPVAAYRIRVDANGTRTLDFITENIADITGYRADDFFNDTPPYESIIHPADAERFHSELEAAIAERTTRLHQEFRVVTATGGEVWLACVTLIDSGDGETVLDGYAIDTTEKKRRDVEFSGLFENASVGVWVIDAAGNTRMANRLFAAMTGRSAGELVGVPARELIAAEEAARLIEEIDMAMTSESPRQFDTNIKGLNGITVPCQVTLSRCPGDDCGQAGLFGIVIDRSRERSLERMHRERDAQFRVLMESAPMGVILYDETIRFVNPALCGLIGADQSELLGGDPGRITDHDGASVLKNIFDRSCSDRTACEYGRRITLIPRTGEPLAATMNACAVEFGGASAVLASIVDISELVRFQESLSHSERRFRDLFTESGAVLLLVDPASLLITGANRAAETFYGTNSLVGTSLAGITDLDDDMIRAEADNAVNGGKRYFVQRQVSADGVRDVEMYASLIGEGGQATLLLIVRDITKRKKAEKDLEQKTKQLEAVTRDLSLRVKEEFEKRMEQRQLLIQQNKLAAMGEMMGAIAHQWRQPLNSLGLIIQDLEDAEAYGEITKEYIADIVSQGMRQVDFMSRTIDDFREFFKPSREKVTFDIRSAVLDVLHLTMSQLRHADIAVDMLCACSGQVKLTPCGFDVRACKEQDLAVSGYPNEFKQVILNIVQNAKDALLTLPPGVKRQLAVAIDRKDDDIELSITDNGGGIPDSVLAKVFEPYFTTKDEGKGTGIGLYMSKMIVENNMGGHLGVAVADGCTTLTIRLKKVGGTPQENT